MSARAGNREQAVAAREATLTRMQEQLADQVGRLATGEGWQTWLSFARSFHQYSFNNCLLIMAQNPQATLVAGYRAWQARGRQVRRGESGIRLFGPVTKRSPKLDAAGAPEMGTDGKPLMATRIVGVRPLSVFDVAQTDGDLLPDRPAAALLTGQAPPGLWESLVAGVQAAGFSVSRGECGGANGVTNFVSRQVRVRADVDDAQAVKTLAHEWAHVLLHAPTVRDPFACRGVVEVEAESVAYLITQAHELDSGQYTFNYVAGWAHEAARPDGPSVTDVLRHSGERVIRAAHTILDHTQPHADTATEPMIDAPTEDRPLQVAASVGPVWEQVPAGPPTVATRGTRGDVPARGRPPTQGAPSAGLMRGDVGGRGRV